MGNLSYLVILYILFSLMIYGAYRAHIMHTDLSIKASNVIYMSALSVIFASIYMYAQIEALAYLSRALFYSSCDWLIYLLGLFIESYIGVTLPTRKLVKGFIVFIIIDTISLMSNVLIHHAFTLHIVTNQLGGKYFAIDEYGPMFYVHQILFYMMMMLVFLAFLYKTVNSSKFNRGRYATIFIIFVVCIVTNIICSTTNIEVDYSILIFESGELVALYFALIRSPQNVQEQFLIRINKELKQGIICYDSKGRVSFMNELAKQVFQIRSDTSKMEKYYKLWMDQFDNPETYSWEEDWKIGDETRHYIVKYEKLYDEENFFIGGFFSIEDCTEYMKELADSEYRATHDSLTDVYNRETFMKEAARTLQANPEKEYCLAVSDINDFKLINDLFGVERGNEVLKREAELLKERAHKGSVYGRIAADQFAVLVEKDSFSEPLFLDSIYHMGTQFTSSVYRMHIYMGVYAVTDHNEDVTLMCDKCIMALNQLKGDYGRVMAHYDEAIMKKALRTKRLVSEFHKAIEQKQFQMYLQPQTNMQGEMQGAEALVRWIHPEEGMISPGEFIPALENSGFIKQLDLYMWTEAVKALKDWKDAGREDKYISVNISPKDFYYVDIYKTLTSLVESYDVSPRNLKLEITESTLITEVNNALPLLERLRRYGFEIEIDDFGSGYSSLNMLKDIKADILKIDMEFIRETENQERSREILSAIIALSEKLGMPVIAEGVETKEQLEMLDGMGCDFYQGYFFSKPVPRKEFESKYLPDVEKAEK